MNDRTTRNVVIAVVGIVIVVLVANLVAWLLDSAVGGSEPEGQPGSSYATTSDGLAAYAQLLADHGHPVQRVRGELDPADLDPGALLVVTSGGGDAFLEAADIGTITAFLAGGGRALLVELSRGEVEAITGLSPGAVEGVAEYRDFVAPLDTLRSVRTDARAAYEPSAGLRTLASEDARILLASTDGGGGETLLLADGSPLENTRIGEADNAAFGLALAGPADTPVVFAEGVHGYGEARGLGALPDRWKLALFVLGAAAVVFAWARARRLGPPDQPDRVLPPARSAYVDAMAGTLEQASDSAAALAPLGAWCRDRIKQQSGLAPDADRDAVDAAARRIGLTEAEIAALWRPPSSREDVIALGCVVARVTDERTLA
ncbi:MAG: DUF4350 domain-containing protein [Acidimicrobiia bacterium]